MSLAFIMDSQRDSFYLPNELWDLIFDHCEQKDFVAISLVCKGLHELIEPFLYREFNWIPNADYPLPPIKGLGGSEMVHLLPEWAEHERTEEVCPDDKWRTEEVSEEFHPPRQAPPYLFLRTLLNRPDLSHNVKHVKLLAVSPDFGLFWNKDQARQCGLRESELDRCYDAIDNLAALDDEDWIDWLHQGRLDVHIGILLSLLSNLSSVEMRVRFGPTSGNVVFRGLCSQRLRRGTFAKPDIKSVIISLDNDEERQWPKVDPWFDEYHMDNEIFWLLQFPQLEHLSVSHLYNGLMEFMFLGNQIKPKLERSEVGRNLKQLKLPHSVVSEEGLDALFSATPHLEDFECDLRYECGAPAFRWGDKLIAALSNISETLRHLKLNFEVLYRYPHDTIVFETPLGSMKHFKKLKLLDIPLMLLVPTVGAVSSSTFEEILPDEMDSLMLRPYPSIMDHDRREMACRALDVYIGKRPWLDEDRRKHLASPNHAKRFGMNKDGFDIRLDRIAGRGRWEAFYR